MVQEIVPANEWKNANKVEDKVTSFEISLDHDDSVPLGVVCPRAVDVNRRPAKVVPILRARIDDCHIPLRVHAMREVDLPESYGKSCVVEPVKRFKDRPLHHEGIVEGECRGFGAWDVGVKRIESGELASRDA